mgnify:CR=1 FL=1
MSFQILKIIDTISQLYYLPLSMERFQKYLYLLQGEKKGRLAFAYCWI